MKNRRNILLCVAGLTPQIITETLYVLAVKEKIRIDEIQVITSTLGRKIVKERLFDSGKWQEFCIDYTNATKGLRFDLDSLEILKDAKGQELPDIRSTRENELAANQICEVVKKLCEQKDTKVYASVAGGRKTMGNYLAFAMSLFAHTGDELSHVLVDEEFERPRKPPLDFYYEPPTPKQVFDLDKNPAKTFDGKSLMTDMAKTTLAEIPFVKLRRILDEDYGKNPVVYKEFVEQVQTQLNLLETEPDLEILLAENKIKISDCEIELTPRDFWIYLIFALRRKKAANDETSAIKYEDLTLEDFDNSLRLITKADNDEFGIDRISNNDDYGFLLDYVKRLGGQEVLNTDSLKKSLGVGISRLNRTLRENKIPLRYQIKAKNKSDGFSFNWISLSSAKIKFIPPI
ncbi:MAG TPA: CRISPR-associated ring nuclease Csm6 [Pyrinomonadaceae bacterium]|jgi:CRISPR-associated protein (TIGR02584 family)